MAWATASISRPGGNRLQQITACVQVLGLVDERLVGIAGQEDNRDAAAGAGTQLADEAEAVAGRHVDIADDDVGVSLSQQRQCLDAVGGLIDALATALFQKVAKNRPDQGLIIDNKNVRT